MRFGHVYLSNLSSRWKGRGGRRGRSGSGSTFRKVDLEPDLQPGGSRPPAGASGRNDMTVLLTSVQAAVVPDSTGVTIQASGSAWATKGSFTPMLQSVGFQRSPSLVLCTRNMCMVACTCQVVALQAGAAWVPAVPEVCPSAAVLLPHSGWAFIAINRPQELPCFTAKDVAALSAALHPDAGSNTRPATASLLSVSYQCWCLRNCFNPSLPHYWYRAVITAVLVLPL